MDHVQKATELFMSGYNCAQSVFAAFCDVTGIDFDTALLLSSSFGGGMGKLREVCGTCSAMFMVAGLLYGYKSNNNLAEKAAHYATVRQLTDAFRQKNKTIICRELVAGLKGINSVNPQPRTAEYYAIRPCVRFVADSAAILEAFIAEREAKKSTSLHK